MGISIVQQTSLANTNSNVNSFATNAFASNPTPGNSIILMLLYELTAAHTISIADTGGNTYTPDQACNWDGTSPVLFDPTATNPSPSTAVIAFLHANVGTSAGSFKTTATVGSSGVGKFSGVALEVSGLASSPYDACGYNGASSNSGTIAVCGASSLTTTNANDLLIAGFCSPTLTGSPSIAGPGGWNGTNLFENGPSTTAAGGVCYEIVSAIQ